MSPDLDEGEEDEKEDGEESEEVVPGRLQGQDENREPVVEAKQLHELQDPDEQDEAADLDSKRSCS